MEEGLKDIFIKIAGSIVFSDNPGNELKKWREFFNISQSELAKYLGINPSVISDYENSKRKSPGINMIKKIVLAFLEIDKEKGSEKLKELGFLQQYPFKIIEFNKPINIREFINIFSDIELINTANLDKKIFGITIINSIETILSNFDLVKIFGSTTERALLFTNISTGRSPMIAIRISNLKPNLIILHNIEKNNLDPLAHKIAKLENIPLILTKSDLKDIENKINNYKREKNE